MKIYYIGDKIVQVNWDKDDFSWDNRSAGAKVLTIDEINPDNKAVCIAIKQAAGKINEAGLPKYFVSGDDLYERKGWTEYINPGDV